MDLTIMIIKQFRLSKSKFQTAIIVALQNMVYITHKKVIEIKWLIGLTCNSSLEEDFNKYNKFIENYITNHVEEIN